MLHRFLASFNATASKQMGHPVHIVVILHRDNAGESVSRVSRFTELLDREPVVGTTF